MIIINKMDHNMLKAWSKQQYIYNETYRPIKFMVSLEVENGIVLLNTMTSELVLITNEEFACLYNGTLQDTNEMLFRFFVVHWFLIPEYFDERTMWKMTLNPRTPTEYFEDRLLKFTIFTTTDCNARCYYCYQIRDTHRVTMTEETANDVADFILKSASPKSVISLSWFGGEPLFNVKAIDIISQKIKDSNRRFQSRMITNGYLINKEIVEKAKTIWNLSSVQITFDGTEDTYNKTKAYVGVTEDDESPFYHIINNMKLLLENKIDINVRINLSMKNIDEIKPLVDVICKELDGYHDDCMLHIYISPLFEDNDNPRSDKERELIYTKKFELDEYLKEKGVFGRKYIGTINGMNLMCMADDPIACTISPEGKLGKCEHDFEDKFYGSIYDDPIGIDYSVPREWRVPTPDIPECESCPVYPRCFRRKGCDVSSLCHRWIQEQKIIDCRNAMMNTYERFKQQNLDTIDDFVESRACLDMEDC